MPSLCIRACDILQSYEIDKQTRESVASKLSRTVRPNRWQRSSSAHQPSSLKKVLHHLRRIRKMSHQLIILGHNLNIDPQDLLLETRNGHR